MRLGHPFDIKLATYYWKDKLLLSYSSYNTSDIGYKLKLYINNSDFWIEHKTTILTVPISLTLSPYNRLYELIEMQVIWRKFIRRFCARDYASGTRSASHCKSSWDETRCEGWSVPIQSSEGCAFWISSVMPALGLENALKTAFIGCK